jgi:fatty acid-binding protein DegV
MDNFEATMIAEGCQEADADQTQEAWQHLIDTGLAWQLQGWFGRQAKALIDAGVCHAAQAKAAD